MQKMCETNPKKSIFPHWGPHCARMRLGSVVKTIRHLNGIIYRHDSRNMPSQWETPLQSNAIPHWLGANLESALIYVIKETSLLESSLLPVSDHVNNMMTSSNGNIFRVTGPFYLTGEFPTQRPATRSFTVFFDLRLNERLSKQSWGWCFETPSRCLRRHCNVLNQLGKNSHTWSETYFRQVLFPAYLFFRRRFHAIVIFRFKSISDLDSGSLPRFFGEFI